MCFKRNMSKYILFNHEKEGRPFTQGLNTLGSSPSTTPVSHFCLFFLTLGSIKRTGILKIDTLSRGEMAVTIFPNSRSLSCDARHPQLVFSFFPIWKSSLQFVFPTSDPVSMGYEPEGWDSGKPCLTHTLLLLLLLLLLSPSLSPSPWLPVWPMRMRTVCTSQGWWAHQRRNGWKVMNIARGMWSTPVNAPCHHHLHLEKGATCPARPPSG